MSEETKKPEEAIIQSGDRYLIFVFKKDSGEMISHAGKITLPDLSFCSAYLSEWLRRDMKDKVVFPKTKKE